MPRASRLPDAGGPFRRTSWLYLLTIGLVGIYTMVFLATGSQPLILRLSGAVTLLLLLFVWFRVHQADEDMLWLTPFEALGIFTIGVGVGGILQVLGVLYVALYFRALRGGVRRALLRAVVYAGAYLAVSQATAPSDFGLTEVLINTAFALPLVAATNALLGRGLRRSGRDQVDLAAAHDEVERGNRRMREGELLAGLGSWEWALGSDRVDISEGLRAIIGLDRDHLSKQEWSLLVFPDDRQRALDAVVGLIAGGAEPVTAEYRMMRPDGEVRDVLVRARRIHGADGATLGAMGTIHDVTDYRALDSELARQQELSEMKSRFLSTVSHELRTPLTSLIGFTETMLDHEYDSETRREFLTLMHLQGAELQALIEDLITFGRVEAGELTLSTQMVELAAEIDMVLAGLGERAGGVRVRVDSRIQLLADPLRVRQIIRNLLDNALKYGDAPIEITARVDGGVAVCAISDSGSGVSAECVETIFEPYRRLVDDRTMSLPGVGLGLPLCRLLSEKQGGSLRYRADQVKPTFELVLPAA